MPAIVNSVVKDSIADELELEQGDKIVSIDDTEMKDLIDYNFLCKSELLVLLIERKNGEFEEIEIEKDFDEDLGIIFESAVFDKIKPCMNRCIFCFVDQQPDGLRKSLYIKDDDYRLSYLQGTYITMTNLNEKDRERIEKLKLGPFYISLHTTNPELRVKMLRNPNAGKIFENLKWLEKNEIPVHLQIVLCPDFNDGKELERTFRDLKKLKNILSVAIVPIGLTKFRREKLKTVDKENALRTIEIVNKFNRSVKKNLACCSDEFFTIAEIPVPEKEYYGEFLQLDDGVGAIRMLLDDFDGRKLPKKIKKPLNLIFASSKSAKYAIEHIVNRLNKIENLSAALKIIEQDFWGEKISVAGLTTSQDLINALKDEKKDKDTIVVISGVMLRPFSEDFLDGKTLTDVKNATGFDFFVIKNFYSTEEIVNFIQSR